MVLALIGTTLYFVLRPTSSAGAAPTATTPSATSTPSSTANAAAGTDPALAAFYTQHLTWHSCSHSQHEQCANVTVPLDYAHPTGPTMKLAMVRIPATDPSRRIGSLLVNPGGPGGSAIEYVESGVAATSTIQARYDLIGLDPRGVGQSSPLECVSDQQLDTILDQPPAPKTPQDIQAATTAAQTLAQGCEAAAANVLPFLGTENAARDMDIVRALLGETKLDYRGESYGTYLGAVYAGLFPQRVGHFVLDGAVDPALTGRQGDLSQARGFETALTAFVTDCLHQSDCPVGPDVQGGLQQVRTFLNGLYTTPLPGDGTRMLTAAQGTTAVIATLYADETWSLLRKGLGQAMHQGQGSTLLRIADMENARGPGGHYTSNLFQVNPAINCVDRGDNTSVAEIQADLPSFEQASPTFGDVLDWGGLICSAWPVKPEITPGPINAAGAPPILVVGTLRDPATPYEEAQHLAAELPNATLLTWDGDGHTAYQRGSTCIDNAVDTFTISGTMPAKNTTCPSRTASSGI